MYSNAIIKLCTFDVILSLYFHLTIFIWFESGLHFEGKVTGDKFAEQLIVLYKVNTKKIVEVGLQVSRKVKSLYGGEDPRRNIVRMFFFSANVCENESNTHAGSVFGGREEWVYFKNYCHP